MTMARHKVVLQDASGNILTSGTITVRNEATGALAQIKSDRAGTTPMSNPYTYTAADNGVVAFHVVGGAYKITVVDAVAGTAEDRYVGIGTAQEQDANEYNTSGYQFQIESGTSGPPTTGCIRFDSGLSSLDTATKAIVSYTTSAGSDVGAALQSLDSGTKTEKNRITLISQGDGTLTVFEVGAVTDHTTWGELALTYVSGATTADSSLNLQPQFSGPDGLNGSNGASALTVVRAVATSNVTIASGMENGDTVDGVTLITGDYVLLTGQSAPAENGVYTVVASGAASRTTAFNSYNSMPGCYFSVQEGTTYGDTLWKCTSDKGGTLGTTALAFSQGVKNALQNSNNLSDVTSPSTARDNVGYPPGYLFGLAISNNALDDVNDLDFAGGSCRDSTDTLNIQASALTKQLDVTYSAGNNAGGRFDASISDGLWYAFRISNGTTVDAGLSKSLDPSSAPNFPAGYKFRRIGAVYRATSIRPFVQNGDYFELKTVAVDVSLATIGTSRLTPTVTVPPNMRGLFRISTFNSGAASSLIVQPTTETDAGPAQGSAPGISLGSSGANVTASGEFNVAVNGSSQIAARSTVASSSYSVHTRGWIDTRGRV